MKIWTCKIGEVDASKLPPGSDAPMRAAIERAYVELTGEDPTFLFSGWGGRLSGGERAVVEGRMPTEAEDLKEAALSLKKAEISLSRFVTVTDDEAIQD